MPTVYANRFRLSYLYSSASFRIAFSEEVQNGVIANTEDIAAVLLSRGDALQLANMLIETAAKIDEAQKGAQNDRQDN